MIQINPTAPFDKICDYFVFYFAGWTLLSHLVVALEGNLYNLLVLYTLFLLAILVRTMVLTQDVNSEFEFESVQSAPTKNSHTNTWLILALIIMSVMLSLALHRADPDDSRYINRAAAMADSPTDPILKYDTMHGVSGSKVTSVTKIVANETLVAAISVLTGAPAIYLFHWLMLSLGGVLLVLAYAGIFRLLTPKYWLVAVFTVMVYLLFDGSTHYSFGNFSFVRLYQGKAFLVSVSVPLIVTYAITFMQQPGMRSWTLLACSQVAAIGMSSTGLMVAPAVAGVALLIGLLAFKNNLKNFVLGLTTSVYSVFLALIFILIPFFLRYLEHDQVSYVIEHYHSVLPNKFQLTPSHVEKAIVNVFGEGINLFSSLFIFAFSWMFCRTRLTRIFSLIFPLVVLVIFANPLFDQLIASRITGPTQYWRIFWILPIPILATLVITSPLAASDRSWKIFFQFISITSYNDRTISLLRLVSFFVVLSIYIGVFWNYSTFRSNNIGVSISLPKLKVRPPYYIAHHISTHVNRGSFVLAPELVSTWIPTFHNRAFPLVSRLSYANFLREEKKERLLLLAYIEGERYPDQENLDHILVDSLGRISTSLMENIVATYSSNELNKAQIFLAAGIESYDLSSITLAENTKWGSEIRALLRIYHYKITLEQAGYEVWTR